MKPHTGTLGVLFLLLPGSALLAQFAPGPVILGPAPGISIEYYKVRKHGGFSFSLNRGYGFYGPLVPAYSVRSTRIIIQGPPIIIASPPDLGLDPIAPLANRLVVPPPEEEFPPPRPRPMPMEDPPLPGRDAGVFKPLDPGNRDRAQKPAPPAPKDQPPPPAPDQLFRRPAPEADPRTESERRIELGKEAFERGEYGRAAERFRQAAELAPNNALPQFLLGQAHIALGNHRRAFDAILAGLRLDPDWPRKPFRPLDLYGNNVTDHSDHTQLLEDLLAATPADPLLLFLTGYQLWFDGRRDEGKLLLQRAAPSLPDPTLLDRFLQALPPADLL